MGDVHSFDVDVARKVGVNAAILLHGIKWWCQKNKANERHYHDGLWWTYNSAKALSELYPYLGKSAMATALKRLEDGGYIKTGNYNKSPYDRTKWYAITEKGLLLFGESISQNREIQSNESGNPNRKSGQPIPVEYQLDTSLKPVNNARRQAAPTIEEVEAYIEDNGYHFDARQFVEYYEASGWHLKNGRPVKNWKQCCVTWEHNMFGCNVGRSANGVPEYLREYDL